MDELDKLIEEYEEMFGEMIPLKMVPLSENQLEEILRESLRIGIPYEIPSSIKKLIEQGAEF